MPGSAEAAARARPVIYERCVGGVPGRARAGAREGCTYLPYCAGGDLYRGLAGGGFLCVGGWR